MTRELRSSIFQAAAWLIDPILRLVLGIVGVRIRAEVFGKNDLIRPGASHREGVADDPPLWLSVQAQAFP